MVLMYLHGFRSTPESKKGQIMREAFSRRLFRRLKELILQICVWSAPVWEVFMRRGSPKKSAAMQCF